MSTVEEVQSAILETAEAFFNACESGRGWEGCKQYCHPNATFACQSKALSEVESVEDYAEFMKGLHVTLPDARWDLHFFGMDEDRGRVAAYATYYGTHKGEGGPVDPTGKEVETDYVYIMHFDDGRLSHMTKVWNDGIAMEQLGWM